MKEVYGLNALSAVRSLTHSNCLMLRALKQVSLFSSDTRELFECRQCGTSVEEEKDSCPECGSSELAEYQL